MMQRTEPITSVPHRFDVEAFLQMWTEGILDEDGRYELIDGEVFEMPKPGPPHCGCVNRLNAFLVKRCDDRAVVHVQNPVVLGSRNWFLPDLALLRPRDDFYSSKDVQPGDVLLAIEVADSSLRKDRDRKAPVYARKGVPELWIVELGGGIVHRFSDLVDGAYGRIEQFSNVADELEIPVPRAGKVTVGEILG